MCVRNQVPLADVGVHQNPQIAAAVHGFAQHVPCGDVDDAVGFHQPAGLSALAGTGGPDKNQMQRSTLLL